jgi:hypothetical protein
MSTPKNDIDSVGKGQREQNKSVPVIIETSPATAITAALSYAFSSIGIQLALKLTLTTYGFPSAIFIALSQCIFMVLCLTIMGMMGKIDFPVPSVAILMAVQPLPLIQEQSLFPCLQSCAVLQFH